MDEIGRVAGLWRYPASSLGGEPMDILTIGPSGADGDRMFGLVEVATDEIARPDGDRKWHKVPRIKARLSPDGVLEIATPESGWLEAPDAISDEVISAYLGFGAAICPFRREHAPSYEGPLTAERYRKAPVHLLTTASMARLKALHPAGDPDARRFRPNIVVEMPEIDGSFPETEWIGRRLAIGDLELTISEPCRRCGFTIIAQDGFDNDPNILRNLVRHNAHNMGVYCTVDRPARVPLGAPMRFL
ncbi:MOSC domain-containing protein [Mesorhizobium sp. LHD-90]|uniref:MOSC domain-containing protein n=1 Tax=Mesorhizobium sp. LHD-90 TaxID=3071414 RepID=UPI0027E0CEEB|nr:MOSC domain-containing protein [Mesorhizobium sp. LHD-90]MDQ6437768.1 MOSC domain-containing protein [Mesorhizobium sp. LHD-90]